MDVNFEQLIKKILDFWKKFDEKEFTVEELRETFNHYELATILFNQDFFHIYHRIIRVFNEKLYMLDNIFTESESEELINLGTEPCDLINCLSDEGLLSLIPSLPDSFARDIAHNLSSDESKIKAFNIAKTVTSKYYFIRNLDSDKLKEKYMRKLPSGYRYRIICSLKDDKSKEKYITFSHHKSDIIASFSSDDKKALYLKKFFLILSNLEKANIIQSFSNEEYMLSFLRHCNDTVRENVLTSYEVKNKSNEFIEKAIQMLSNEKSLFEVLLKNRQKTELVIKYIDRITNLDKFLIIAIRLNDQGKFKCLEKYNDNKNIKIIGSINDGNLKFKSFSYLSDKNLIFELIPRSEEIPEYSDEYEYIIELYANKYNIKKERLLFAVKNVSFSILRVIENENILKIFSASEDSFMKTMQILSKEQLQIDSNAANDIINSLLQRKFRNNYPEIIFIFPNMLNQIQNKNKTNLLNKLKEISRDFDINSEILKNNWSMEEFIDLLLEGNQKAIDCLHEICSEFIELKRNKYVQENFSSAMNSAFGSKYDKNALMQYMILNYPVELIMTFFFEDIDMEIGEDVKELTETEKDLVINRDLIKKIILYKKNPQSYNPIPDEIKNNLRLFNSVFEKLVASKHTGNFNDFTTGKKNYNFRPVDEYFLVNVMMNLDIDRLDKVLFKNPQLLNSLMKILKQYKICGWGNLFEYQLNELGVAADANTVANLIQYFGLAYEDLQKDKGNQDTAKISLTSLLDYSLCCSSESKKYSIILGADNFRYLITDPGTNTTAIANKNDRIKKVVPLLKIIRTRTTAPVPTMDQDFTLKNGKQINIVVGNFSNAINLTFGERTNTCTRIDGAGNDLFNFCLGNDNGFYIKFSNPKTGKFATKLCCIRNGNTVFFNELPESQDTNYTNSDLLEVCKLIANELINLSKGSSVPIENVVISSYRGALANLNLPSQTIGISKPMEGLGRVSQVNTPNLILATTDPNNNLVKPKLGLKHIPKYPAKRDKQRILYNEECQEYVAHLKGLDQVLSGTAIENIDIELDSNLVVCFAGEDWCITIDKDGNIDEYIMKNSNNRQQAIDEAQAALVYLKENLEKEIEIANSKSMGM